MSRFVVDLGTLKLDASQEQAISAAIQAAVLAVLADHKISTDKLSGLIPGGGIRGFVLREKIAELEPAVAEISKFVGR